MKKQLKKIYHRIGGERFEKGVYGLLKLAAFAFLFAVFFNLLSACRRTDNLEAKVYEVKTGGITYQTSESNKRKKEPVKRTRLCPAGVESKVFWGRGEQAEQCESFFVRKLEPGEACLDDEVVYFVVRGAE